MNDLRTLANPFQSNGLDIRTAVDQDDQVWFCAIDVCRVFGLYDDAAISKIYETPNNWIECNTYLSLKRDITNPFINESGLFRLTFSINDENAIEFSNWVCQEVLPTLRKNGFFGTVSGPDRLAYSKHIAEVSTLLTATKDAMLHKMLISELRDCCNAVGCPMPDLTLLGKDYKQLDLIGNE